MSAVVVFIIFAICLIIAIPISISLGIVAVLPGAFDASFTASAGYVIRSMVGGIDSFPLLAVPMFVLAGILMAHGKISEKLFDVFVYFLGNKRAGIPCAVIITCLFYGAISGSAPVSYTHLDVYKRQGNTFADITFFSELNFVDPFRISDQSTSHSDKVSVAFC